MEQAHGPQPCSPVSECAETPRPVIPLDTLLKRALGLDQEEMLPFICLFVHGLRLSFMLC